MGVFDRANRLPGLPPSDQRRGVATTGTEIHALSGPVPARRFVRAGAGPRIARPRLRTLAALLLLATAQARSVRAGSTDSAPRAVPGSPTVLAALPADCAAAQRAAREQASRLQAAAARLEALLLGEIHTSAADHAWQLATLEAVRQRRPQLTLALEMIPAARQPVLDRYSAGQITEETFFQQVGWPEVWGHDPELYLPLLRWARQRQVPLLGLNAEPKLVKLVRRQGLAAIPQAEREGIGTPAPISPAYARRLETIWRGHRAFAATTAVGSDGPMTGGHGASSSGAAPARSELTPAEQSDLRRFLDSQLLRDRAMAERIAAAQRRDPARLVVALLGRGHLEGGDGVPLQLADLGLHQQLSLTRPNTPDGCGPAPARARLGAYLESENGAVWVRRVAPDSAAAAAGLRPGDRILELNGMAVDHAGQVIRGVRLQPDGQPLRLTIERAGRRLRLTIGLPPSSAPQQAARDNGAWSRPAVLRTALSPP